MPPHSLLRLLHAPRRIAVGATAALLATLFVAGAVTTGHGAGPGEPAPARAALAARLAEFRRPATPEPPSDNQPSAERLALGRDLFMDPRLSRDGTVACASCHQPDYQWTDRRATSVGVAGTPQHRRSQTLLDLQWAAALFWDGRAESLEDQALGPVQSDDEMGMPLPALEARLNAVAEYRRRFRAAYAMDSITARGVALALAQFERSLVTRPAPFDAWVAGDEGAVTPAAKRGFALFTGRAGCAQCHGGWRFTDDSFHDIGVPVHATAPDSGRARLVPLEPMRFAFKTPTLREVARRAPYLHDGSAPTLDAVLDLYDRGGHGTGAAGTGAPGDTAGRRASISPLIRPLHLTAGERRDLLAFLRTLSSPDTLARPLTRPSGRPARAGGAR